MAQNATRDDAQDARLDDADLSTGDVVRVEFADDDLGSARYKIEGEWSTDETADLERLDHPSEDAEGMFPGLQATRVWTENPGDYQRLPHRRATLVLDADSATAAVVDNYPGDEHGATGYEVLSVRDAERLSFEDRADLRGSLNSPGASHVVRVVREAFENVELLNTTRAESVTIKGADESGADCFGNDMGVTVYITANLSLQVQEAFEAYLYENLNADYWFEKDRATTYTFLVDRNNDTHPVR